jgi:hypothetical protein
MISHGKLNVKIGDMEARYHSKKVSMPIDLSNTKLPDIKKDVLTVASK